jgi:hypothetical protein
MWHLQWILRWCPSCFLRVYQQRMLCESQPLTRDEVLSISKNKTRECQNHKGDGRDRTATARTRLFVLKTGVRKMFECKTRTCQVPWQGECCILNSERHDTATSCNKWNWLCRRFLWTFTAMKTWVAVFWVMSPCNDVVRYWCFGGRCCLRLQGEYGGSMVSQRKCRNHFNCNVKHATAAGTCFFLLCKLLHITICM